MNLLIPVKIFFQVACLQKLHWTQQSGKVAGSSKAGIEKDRDKIRKNGIRFSKTDFPILLISQYTCYQKLHETILKVIIEKLERVLKIKYYFFWVACLQKLHQTQQSDKVTGMSKAEVETLTNVDITCLQMQMIGVGKYNFFLGEIRRCSIPLSITIHHQIFLSITIHHTVGRAEWKWVGQMNSDWWAVKKTTNSDKCG